LSRVVYIGISNVVWSILLIIFLIIGLAIGYMIPRPGVVSVATQTQTITVPGPGGATITMPITITSSASCRRSSKRDSDRSFRCFKRSVCLIWHQRSDCC